MTTPHDPLTRSWKLPVGIGAGIGAATGMVATATSGQPWWILVSIVVGTGIGAGLQRPGRDDSVGAADL